MKKLLIIILLSAGLLASMTLPRTASNYASNGLKIQQVCLNGVVYYYSNGYQTATLAPKITITNEGPAFEVCKGK